MRDEPSTAFALGIRLPAPDGTMHFRALIYNDQTWMDAVRTVDRWHQDPEIGLPSNVAEFFVKRIVQEVSGDDPQQDYGEIRPEL